MNRGKFIREVTLRIEDGRNTIQIEDGKGASDDGKYDWRQII